MSTFLETLKTRLADAQKRHQEVTLRFQKIQAELQAIQQEFVSWQNAVNAETRKEALDAAVTAAVAATPAAPASNPVQEAASTEINKTEMIREILRQHPGGITPAELWKSVQGRIKHRAYVYAVLKRLKDGEHVLIRRGKYSLRIQAKPEEAKPQLTVQ